jgi:hypothetical protein
MPCVACIGAARRPPACAAAAPVAEVPTLAAGADAHAAATQQRNVRPRLRMRACTYRPVTGSAARLIPKQGKEALKLAPRFDNQPNVRHPQRRARPAGQQLHGP